MVPVPSNNPAQKAQASGFAKNQMTGRSPDASKFGLMTQTSGSGNSAATIEAFDTKPAQAVCFKVLLQSAPRCLR